MSSPTRTWKCEPRMVGRIVDKQQPSLGKYLCPWYSNRQAKRFPKYLQLRTEMSNNSQSRCENTQMRKSQLIDHHIILRMLNPCCGCFPLRTTQRPEFFRLLQASSSHDGCMKICPPDDPASGTVGAEGVTWPHSLLRRLDLAAVTLTPLYTHTSSPLWTFGFWMVLGDTHLGWSNAGIPDYADYAGVSRYGYKLRTNKNWHGALRDRI